jgi:hypothetical protein
MKTFLILLLLDALACPAAARMSPKSAKDHIGKIAKVCGKVTGTHLTRSGKILINFGG